MSEQVLGVINPVLALIFSIGAFLIWRRDTSQRYILGMAIAPLALGISFTINHYFVFEDALVMRLLTSLFAFAAVIAIVWSTCMRLQKSPPLVLWLLAGAASLALMGFSDPANDVTVWVFTVNSMCGLVFATGAQLLVQANSRDPIDRATVQVFVLIAAQFFLRPPILYLIDGPMGSDAYRESVGHAVYIVVGAVSMVLLSAVLMSAAISDLIKALKTDAQTDSLSGLVMRDAFVERATQKLAEAGRENVPVALIVADIDHFKKVNDVWGHPAGDEAIATFGQVVLATVRDTDMVGRIGGEEFGVLVWNCPEEPAARLAERLRVKFACAEHEQLGCDIRLTASFGVTTCHPGESYHQAYERADAALYKAKRGGRNQVVSEQVGPVGPAPGVTPGSASDGDAGHSGNGADIVKLTNNRNTRKSAV